MLPLGAQPRRRRLLEIPLATRDNRIVPAGRPSSYTPEIADAICERIAGGESVTTISASEGFPSRTTIRNWMDSNPDFRSKCARAWDLQADVHAEKVRELADKCEAGTLDPNAARVASGNRQWLAARMSPRRWGERQQVDQRLVDEQGHDREPLSVVFVGVGAPAVAARGKPPALALQPPEESE